MNAHACLYPEFYEHHPWVMTFVLITFLLFVILSFSWHNKHKGNGLNHGRSTPNGQSRIYMLQRRKVCRAVSSNKNVYVWSQKWTIDSHMVFSQTWPTRTPSLQSCRSQFSYADGSFFQSSLSQTGWFRSCLIREVPLKALVRGRCPSGAFFTS